ncbi:MAG TPA: GNAT family N-acetyltransferase [Acidimicrobiales bacterium]|nr:GNAT family N-acetyltransferase [Acidimicrobiales bacterium]
MIEVVEAEQADDELVAAFTRLVPQLSRSTPPPTREELAEMVAAPGTHVLLARDGAGTVVGALTLVTFRIPTGVRAWVEDVVVDESARRRGVGETLTRRALEIAVAAGARTVDLTSRPEREAANRLYARLGFHPRATNVYRWTPGDGAGVPAR